MLHKIQLRKFSFDLKDTIVRPNSSYSVILDIKASDKGLNVKFRLKEKITPFDNVERKLASNAEYGSGEAFYETGHGHEIKADESICKEMAEAIDRLDLYYEDTAPTWVLRDFLLCRNSCT